MTEAKVNLLVVDDDELTAESVERSLRKVNCNFPILTAMDGEEALDILNGRSPKVIARPLLILLDLNMPRMNGFEFLEVIRGDEKLKDSVVFVLTTSDADSDRARAYNQFIAGYMVKSEVGPQFTKLAKLLMEYATSVALPT